MSLLLSDSFVADWLIVECSWKEDFMKQTKIRVAFLLPPMITSLVFAGVPLTVFCYLAPYPPGCHKDLNVDCSRGEKANFVQSLQFFYTMVCNVGIITFMSSGNVRLTHIYHRDKEEVDN